MKTVDFTELVLHFDPLNPLVKAEMIDKSGATHVKCVTPDKLVSELKNHSTVAPMPTGLLPPNCVALTAYPDGWDVILVCDFDRCDVTYHKTVYADFPLPHMAIRCHINTSGVLSKFQLAVLKPGQLAPDLPLYVCPFPNVMNFQLCTGTNSFTGYDMLLKMQGVPYRVLSIPFADDWYKPEDSRLGLSARDLFTHLQDKTPEYYYSDVLIPSGKTLSDFMESGEMS